MTQFEKPSHIKTLGKMLGIALLWIIWLSLFEDGVAHNISSAARSGGWDWISLGSLNIFSTLVIFSCLCIFTFRQYKRKRKALWITSFATGLITLTFAILSGLVSYVYGLPNPEVTNEESDKLLRAFNTELDSTITIPLSEYTIEYAKDQYLIISKPTSYWMKHMPLLSRRLYRHSDYSWHDNRKLLENARSTLHKRFVPEDFKSLREQITNKFIEDGYLLEIESQHGHTLYDWDQSDFVRYLDWRYPGKIYTIVYFNDNIELTAHKENTISIKKTHLEKSDNSQNNIRAMYAFDVAAGTIPYDVYLADSFVKSFTDTFRYGIDEIANEFRYRIEAYEGILKTTFGIFDIKSAIQNYDACWESDKECVSIADATQAFFLSIKENDAQGVTERLIHSFLTDDQIEHSWDLAMEYDSTNTVSELYPFVDKTKRGLWLNDELYSSVKAGNTSMVGALLTIMSRNDYRFSRETLFWAVENSDVDIVNLLLEHGFSPNIRGGKNRRPIHIAARSGRPEIIETLIDHGADINSSDRNGDTVLQYAIKDDYQAETLLILFENPDLDVNEMDRQFYIEKLRQYIKMQTSQTVTFDDAKIADWKSGKLIDYLDKSGNMINANLESFHQTPWHCIEDEVSGLTWTVKHDMGGVHDQSLEFWKNEPEGSLCEQAVCSLNEVIQRSNENKLCNQIDWRIPTVTELASLAYPQYKSAFPFSPGFLFWTYYGDSLVITSADGILGERSTIEDPFSGMNEPHARVLLVSGVLKSMPEEPSMNYQAKFFDN
ncbi:ankyrin repeat domain-containing protein [Saccharospirillum salsuginis]|uniref:Lcl C-terminal domain-containing protein n=1 Tax=Saccharospirillum salsuginis TaxID=418750 RepID=A0A918JZP3_9GAMM|nr:ankyrin repeat domain-containing protein [Saccharospirillum salsuginis]GGX38659.1 hypothetical protein GCM10007392_01080 [Saccharospirillum salsuginis]